MKKTLFILIIVLFVETLIISFLPDDFKLADVNRRSLLAKIDGDRDSGDIGGDSGGTKYDPRLKLEDLGETEFMIDGQVCGPGGVIRLDPESYCNNKECRVLVNLRVRELQNISFTKYYLNGDINNVQLAFQKNQFFLDLLHWTLWPSNEIFVGFQPQNGPLSEFLNFTILWEEPKVEAATEERIAPTVEELVVSAAAEAEEERIVVSEPEKVEKIPEVPVVEKIIVEEKPEPQISIGIARITEPKISIEIKEEKPPLTVAIEPTAYSIVAIEPTAYSPGPVNIRIEISPVLPVKGQKSDLIKFEIHIQEFNPPHNLTADSYLINGQFRTALSPPAVVLNPKDRGQFCLQIPELEKIGKIVPNSFKVSVNTPVSISQLKIDLGEACFLSPKLFNLLGEKPKITITIEFNIRWSELMKEKIQKLTELAKEGDLPLRPGTGVECSCDCLLKDRGYELHRPPPVFGEGGKLLSVPAIPSPSPPCTESDCRDWWCTKPSTDGPECSPFYVGPRVFIKYGKAGPYDGTCTTAGYPPADLLDQIIGSHIASGFTTLLPEFIYEGGSPGAGKEMEDAGNSAKSQLFRIMTSLTDIYKEQCNEELCDFSYPYILEAVQFWCVDDLSPRPPEHFNHITWAHYKLTAYFICKSKP